MPRDREVAFLVDSLRLDEVIEVTESFDGEVRGLRRELSEPEARARRHARDLRARAAAARAARGHLGPRVRERAAALRARGERSSRAAKATSETLAASEPIFRLDAGTRSACACRCRRSARACCASRSRARRASTSSRSCASRAAPHRGSRASSVPLEEIAREQGDGRTVVELARPSGLVPAWLTLETRTGTLRRAVAVYDEQQGSADLRLGAGTLYRLAGGDVENLLVYLRPGARREPARRDRGRRQPGARGAAASRR